MHGIPDEYIKVTNAMSKYNTPAAKVGKEVFPSDFMKALIKPLHKIGDKSECGKYQGY